MYSSLQNKIQTSLRQNILPQSSIPITPPIIAVSKLSVLDKIQSHSFDDSSLSSTVSLHAQCPYPNTLSESYVLLYFLYLPFYVQLGDWATSPQRASLLATSCRNSWRRGSHIFGLSMICMGSIVYSPGKYREARKIHYYPLIPLKDLKSLYIIISSNKSIVT